MATRAAEAAFARRAFGERGEAFFATACGGCHVRSCTDCHGDAARPGRPADEACLRCHRGYFVGWDYHGRAPREDHSRYQRGAVADGEPFLKMLPDVHQERGIACADCHTMRRCSREGRRRRPAGTAIPESRHDVPEHAIRAHLEKMECQACHAAWAPAGIRHLPRAARDGGAEGSVLAAAGLGRVAQERLPEAPGRAAARAERARASVAHPAAVHPLRHRPGRGWENRLLAAEWKAFSPHTIRRGGARLRRLPRVAAALPPRARRGSALPTRQGRPARCARSGTAAGRRSETGASSRRTDSRR